MYAGYVGGSGYDVGIGIAVDSAGNAYVTGDTNSTQATFPVKVGPDLSHNGGIDAFIAKVRADGTGLVYAGYVGGSGGDIGFDIAVDRVGNAYVTGYTTSDQTTFPETVGPDLSYNGHTDAFVVKVNAIGSALVYAGYIGGAGTDYGNNIAVDRVGNAYLTGSTWSDQTTFPKTAGPDLSYNGVGDAFVAKVNATGTALVYAGYIGGAGDDEGLDIAVDSAGTAYVTGNTASDQTTFPETVGPDLSHNGGYDAFVAKIGGLPLAGIGVYRTTVPNVGRWYLDANRDGLLNVCTIDKCLGPFGVSTDSPSSADGMAWAIPGLVPSPQRHGCGGWTSMATESGTGCRPIGKWSSGSRATSQWWAIGRGMALPVSACSAPATACGTWIKTMMGC